MRPPQGGMTQNPAACLPYLLVQISFLTAESAKPGVDTGPCVAAAREQPQALHPDLEWLCTGLGDAFVNRPLPVHCRAPARVEVTRARPIEPVIHQRPLDQVAAVGVIVEPAGQRGKSAWLDEDVTVHAAYDVRVRLAEDQITHRGAVIAAERHVPEERNPILQGLEAGRRCTLGVVIDDQERDLVGYLGVIKPDCLNGEPDAIKVVEGGHSHTKMTVSASRCHLGDRTTRFLRQGELLEETASIRHHTSTDQRGPLLGWAARRIKPHGGLTITAQSTIAAPLFQC